MYKKMAEMPLEKKFLWIAIVLGVLFILILPPGQSPDEIMHFRRAYGISEGVFIPSEVAGTNGNVGSAVPEDTEEVLVKMPEKGYYGQVAENLGERATEKTEQVYSNTALYNFVCYIPQTLAIMVGKVLGFSTLGMAYLAEICNFVIWVILVYFAIKLIPKFKKMVLFVALLPITLQEATSLAPDALAIGLGLFLVSYILYLTYAKKKVLDWKNLTVLYIVAGVIGFCKIVYLPLILLMITIPAERFGSKKRKWIHLGIIALVVGALNLAWLTVSSGLLVESNPGVDSKEQLMGILTHPLSFGATILRTINMNIELWMNNMLGMSLGAFSFNLPNVLFYISFGFLVVLLAQRDERLEMKLFDRWVFIITFAVIMLLICVSLYIQWTPVGAPVIDGIQGRYFLPILLLIPVMLVRTKNKKPHAELIGERGIMYYSLLINIVALGTIFAQNI